MNLTEAPLWIRLALCTFEGLRRLGFPPENIFFVTAPQTSTGRLTFFVSLEHEGRSLFSVGIQSVEAGTVSNMTALFTEASKTWNDPANRADCAEMYATTLEFNKPAFLLALMNKGLLGPGSRALPFKSSTAASDRVAIH